MVRLPALRVYAMAGRVSGAITRAVKTEPLLEPEMVAPFIVPAKSALGTIETLRAPAVIVALAVVTPACNVQVR